MLSRILATTGALKGWRTLILSVAVAGVGVLQTADWTTLVGNRAVGPVMIAIGAAVGVLRAVTDTPLGRK